MLIFIFLILIILLIGFIFKYKNIKNGEKYFLIISFIFLFFISGFRHYSIGVDTEQYYFAYKLFGNLDFSNLNVTRYEIGFNYLCEILFTLNSNPQLLLIVSSFFINLVIIHFIYKNSNNVILSVLLFILMNFYFSSMNIMRQFIAISFVLIGFEYLKKEKNLYFLIFVFIASLFHGSAILSLLLLIFKKMNYSKKFLLYTLLISIFCFVLGKEIFLFLSNFSPRLSDYIGGDFFVENYFGALFDFIIYLFVFGLGFYLIKTNKSNIFFDKSSDLNIYLGIMGIAVVLTVLVMKVSIFNRFSPYFTIFSIIWLPNVISLVKNWKNRLFLIFLVVLLFMFYFIIILLLRPEWYGVTPFKFCF